MKIQLVKLLFTSILFVFLNCDKSTYCQDCTDNPLTPEKLSLLQSMHPILPFSCSDTISNQLFTFDLINDYVIVGKAQGCEDNTVKSILFDIAELGDCKRYKIANVKWEKPTNSLFDPYTLTFTINGVQNQNEETSFLYVNNGNAPLVDSSLTKLKIDSNPVGIDDTPGPPTDTGMIGDQICPLLVKNIGNLTGG